MSGPARHRTPAGTDAASREPVPDLVLDLRMQAIEAAANQALLAPSVHNTQPWLLVLHRDRIEVLADRRQQLTAIDPLGRELVLSVGAALFNLRVALAARGWAVEVDRLPRPDDADLLAVVRPVAGEVDPLLVGLDPIIAQRRTNRRRLAADDVPDDVVQRLVSIAADEDTELVPVQREHHRGLVARLTQQADALQNADAASRAELKRWTMRPLQDAHGIPVPAVRHVDGQVDLTAGAGQALLLLSTRSDDLAAWLRCGETLEHLLLELTRLGWLVSPMTQVLEVPVTRAAVRSALAGDAHPQVLLRIGHAEEFAASPRRPRSDVVRVGGPLVPPSPERRTTPVAWPPGPSGGHGRRVQAGGIPAHRAVSAGRGGTTWI